MAMTPMRAIRAKCLECSNDNVNEVRECPITDCALYPFRFGHNPNIKLSDEEKARRAELVRASTMPKVAENRPDSRAETD